MTFVSITPVRIALSLLTPEEFQSFCDSFLRDLGYRTQLGPMVGPDGGQDIIGYTPGGHRFIAHCTTMKGRSRIREKFIADALRSAQSDQKSRIGTPQEIVFLSVESAFSDNARQVKFVIEELMPELHLLDDRYNANDTHTIFYNGERIDAVLSARTFSDSKRILEDKFVIFQNQILSPDLESRYSEDYSIAHSNSDTKIKPFLREYHLAQSDLRRSQLLPEILELLWGAVSKRNLQWDQLANIASDSPLARFITCLSLLRQSVLQEPDLMFLFQFIGEARTYKSFDSTAFNIALDVFVMRLIRNIFYRFPSIIR